MAIKTSSEDQLYSVTMPIRAALGQPKYLFPLLGILTFAAMQLLGYNGLYGQDSYEYVRYCDAWISFFQTGVHPGDYHWPLNFPVIGAVLAAPLSLTAETLLPLISLAAICLSCSMVCHMLRWMYPSSQGAMLWVVLALFLAPYGFRLAVSSMSDTLGAMFCLACFYFTLRAQETDNDYHLVWVAFFAGMAVMTRYVAALVLAPLALYWVFRIFRFRRWGPSLMALPALMVPMIPHLWVRLGNTANITDHAALTRWTVAHFFTRHFESDLGSFDFVLPNILYVGEVFAHPGFLFFGVLLIPFYGRIFNDKRNYLFAACVLLFLVFIAGVDTQNSRYFIVILPLTTVLLFPAFHQACSRLKEHSPTLLRSALPLLLIVQVGLTAYAFGKTYGASRSERELAAQFSDFQDQRIYCYGTSMMLSHYNKKNEFVTLHGIDENVFEPGDYYLHHESWEEHRQLKDLYHVEMYRRYLSEGRFVRMEELNAGWVLYRYP